MEKKKSLKKKKPVVKKKTTKKPATKKKVAPKKKGKSNSAIKKKNVSKTKPYDSKTVNSKIEDEHGNWDGSTMTDDSINAIENPEEKKLAEELDKLQEELKELREQGDKDLQPDINNKFYEIQAVREKLNKINPAKYM